MRISLRSLILLIIGCSALFSSIGKIYYSINKTFLADTHITTFSNTDSLLVAGDYLGRLFVWDIVSGRSQSWATASSSVRAISCSSDGKYIISGGDSRAELWRTSDHTLLDARDLKSPIIDAVFSKSGNLAAISTGSETIVFEIKNENFAHLFTTVSPGMNLYFLTESNLLIDNGDTGFILNVKTRSEETIENRALGTLRAGAVNSRWKTYEITALENRNGLNARLLIINVTTFISIPEVWIFFIVLTVWIVSTLNKCVGAQRIGDSPESSKTDDRTTRKHIGGQ